MIRASPPRDRRRDRGRPSLPPLVDAMRLDARCATRNDHGHPADVARAFRAIAGGIGGGESGYEAHIEV